MAHINIDEFRGIKVQLSWKQLSSNSKVGIRPPLISQSQAGAGLAVSCPTGVLLRVALILLCLLQFAQGSSTGACIEVPRIATEHSIQARGLNFTCHYHIGPAPENDRSCSISGGGSCWSCLDQDNSKPSRQPFILQSPFSYGRSQASLGRDVVPRKSSLGNFTGGLSDQLRIRKLGPVDNNSAAEEWRTKEGPDVEAQHWSFADITTVCSRDPTLSSVASPGSFSRVMLDQKNLQLEVASWSWRCNSTIIAAQMTTAASADSTAAATASSDFGTTTLSLHKTMEIRKSDPWLLQILEAINEELHADSCDYDNPLSLTGRRISGRRVLISDSWKPVIVVDSVIVAIGFFLALSALSCWVWQWREVKSNDRHDHLPARQIMPPSSVCDDIDRIPSPRRMSISGRECPGRGSLAMEPSQVRRSWSQVKDGPGRWEQVPEEGILNGEQLVTEQLVTEEGPGRGSQDVEEGPGGGPLAAEHSPEKGPGTGQGEAEEGGRRGSRAAEEGPGGGSSSVTCQGPLVVSPKAEDEPTGATVHRSWQTARYRVEPFCFQGLAAATGDFDESNKLGAGSFGNVYRGLLFDGREVAIKRADRNNMEKIVDKRSAFTAELDAMSRLHHKHLVNLVGYCDDCGEMMLVYEYMPNGTLADHLHNKRFQSRSLYSWKVRIKVALQAARGIEYLHTYAEPPVIHRDIKSSNILVDAEGSVRVSDFGLCLIFPSSSDEEEEVEHITTKAAGTMGYMDPEYYRHRHLTTKSDVYSFGVVILELLTGKWAIHRRNSSHVSVVDYAVPAIEADDLASILDPRVQVVSRDEFAAIKVMAEVGSHAVRLRGKDRPSITEIIRRLEHAVTLCRSRHAPIPVFGTHIGSSTDLSPSPRSRPSGPSTDHHHGAAFPSHHPAATPFDEFAEGVDDDEEEDQGPSGTDIAQVGSVSTSSQVRVLDEILQDIHAKGIDRADDDDEDDFDHYHSNVDMQFRYDSADSHDELLRRRRSSADAPDSSMMAMDFVSSSSAAAALAVASAAATGYQGGGQVSGPQTSTTWQRTPKHRETLLQKLQESWQQSWPSDTMGGKFARSSVLGSTAALPIGGASYDSCEGGSTAVSRKEEVPLEYYSGMVVDDPLLDRKTSIMAGFSNFSDLGPPEDVNPAPPSPPPSQDQQQEVGSQLVPGAAHGRRVAYHGKEPSYGLGLAAGDYKGGEFECLADDNIGDIDIESFLDEYSDEQAGSTSYAGFSDFSVLNDLDELMKALHSLQAKQEQEDLEEFHEQKQQSTIPTSAKERIAHIPY